MTQENSVSSSSLWKVCIELVGLQQTDAWHIKTTSRHLLEQRRDAEEILPQRLKCHE